MNWIHDVHSGNVARKLGLIKRMCVVGLGIPQPIMLVNISDIGKKLTKDELIELSLIHI